MPSPRFPEPPSAVPPTPRAEIDAAVARVAAPRRSGKQSAFPSGSASSSGPSRGSDALPRRGHRRLRSRRGLGRRTRRPERSGSSALPRRSGTRASSYGRSRASVSRVRPTFARAKTDSSWRGSSRRTATSGRCSAVSRVRSGWSRVGPPPRGASTASRAGREGGARAGGGERQLDRADGRLLQALRRERGRRPQDEPRERLPRPPLGARPGSPRRSGRPRVRARRRGRGGVPR